MIKDIPSLLARSKDYGLELVTDKTELDSSGLDFLVLHAHDKTGQPWVVRTPRHPKAYEGTINEAKILAFLKPRVSIEIPDWRIHQTDLIAYPRLQGTPTWTYDHEAGLSWNGLNPDHPQDNFLDSSARFLAELHVIDPQSVAAHHGRLRSISEVRDSIVQACYDTKEILNPPDKIWQRWFSWLEDDSFWPEQPALVHGDFHPGHMLLDDDLKLTGVLDWTEAEVADPSVDFGIFFGCFGKDTLARFLELYEGHGGHTYPRLADHVKERWAAYAPLVASWGVKNDNPDVIEHGKAQLAAALQT